VGVYDESGMKDLRGAFEREVLRWPDVTSKKMFGCPTFLARGTIFAFLVTGGIVVTELPEADREALRKARGADPFRAGPRSVPRWVQLEARSPDDVTARLPVVRDSYERALRTKGRRGRRGR